MSDTPIEHLRHVLDEALDMVNAGYFPDELIEEAIAGIDQIEEDAAVGAAMRECAERGLIVEQDYAYPNKAHACCIHRSPHSPRPYPRLDRRPEAGLGPTLPEALADWKQKNEVEE